MRHRNSKRTLGRSSAHRKSLLRNLATSLLWHEQISTTLAKAKSLRPVVEKLITLGKKGDLHHRRLAAARLTRDDVVQKLFDVLADRYRNRTGGYTRVVKIGFRHGDSAPVAVIELVDRDERAKGRDPGKEDDDRF